MTLMFLHFFNAAATFRIWSSGKKTPYLKFVSSHFLTLAIELHLVCFRGGASFTFELHAHYHPHICCCYYFTSHKKISYFASTSFRLNCKSWVSHCFILIQQRLNSSSDLQYPLLQWFSTFPLKGAKSRLTTLLEGHTKEILTQVTDTF